MKARRRHAWKATKRPGVKRCAHCGALKRELFAASRRGAARVVVYRAHALVGDTGVVSRVPHWTTRPSPCL